MFGTFEDEAADEPEVFGVRKPLANWNPIWANLQVYNYLLFDARNALSWSDKFGVWLRRTGWRPADVEAQFPRAKSDVEHFEKFDPPVPVGQRRYVLAQFAVAIIGALFIAEQFAQRGAVAVLVPCLMLWLQLYTLGLLSEGRQEALRAELLRLLLAMPLLFLLMQQTPAAIERAVGAWLVLGLYAMISSLWLFASYSKSKTTWRSADPRMLIDIESETLVDDD